MGAVTCPDCPGRSFKNDNGLQTHIGRIHKTGPAPARPARAPRAPAVEAAAPAAGGEEMVEAWEVQVYLDDRLMDIARVLSFMACIGNDDGPTPDEIIGQICADRLELALEDPAVNAVIAALENRTR